MKKLYQLSAYCFVILITLLHLQASAQTTNGTISGTIKTSDGNPAPYVTVAIKETNKGTVTSESGAYVIKNLKEGTYTLRISYTGLQTQEKRIQVTGGKSTQVDVSLAETANKLAEIQIVANKTSNQKVVTVGKGGIAARDLPQSVQILDSTLITDQQANRLVDVLRNVNGVAFAESRGSTGDTFLARGYSLGGNNVLKNGARSSIGGSPEASTLESVEVLKGSAALLYGGVTGGAVINMVTKKPKFNYGGEVSMRTGSYGFYKPTVDFYGPISKKVAFRVIGTKDNADSFRDQVKTNRLYVNPSLLFKLGKNTELLAQGDYLKSDYTPDFGIGTIEKQIVNIGRNKFVNAPWAYNKTNTVTGQLNLNHKFNETWKLNIFSNLQSYNRNYFSAERPFADTKATNPLPYGFAARNVTRSKSREFTYNQQVNLNGAFKTGNISHTVLVGADADQSRTTSNGFTFNNNLTAFNYGNVNLLDPSTYYGSGIEPTANKVSETFAPLYRMGAFAQDLVGITDQLKVLAGIRYTFQKTPRTWTTVYSTGVQTPSNNSLGKSKVESAFSPKFGIVYQPIQSSSIYVSYANNFTSNTGTDVNKAPLDPSIIDQYEVGVKNDLFSGRMSFNVTWYKIINNNLAQTALFQADGVTPNADATIKEFSGKTASEGLEIDITGKLAKGLNFIAGYSYSYYRFTKTLASGITEGERVIGSTPHSANGTVFYTFGSGKVKGLKLGASAFYVGERNSGFQTLKPPFVARGLPIIVSSFTTIDFSAGYSFRKLSILGKLSNITNELNYYVHENYSINPIPPRMFSATLAYKFDL